MGKVTSHEVTLFCNFFFTIDTCFFSDFFQRTQESDQGTSQIVLQKCPQNRFQQNRKTFKKKSLFEFSLIFYHPIIIYNYQWLVITQSSLPNFQKVLEPLVMQHLVMLGQFPFQQISTTANKAIRSILRQKSLYI